MEIVSELSIRLRAFHCYCLFDDLFLRRGENAAAGVEAYTLINSRTHGFLFALRIHASLASLNSTSCPIIVARAV
jgi:hypothetical protein